MNDALERRNEWRREELLMRDASILDELEGASLGRKIWIRIKDDMKRVNGPQATIGAVMGYLVSHWQWFS